MTTWYFFKIEPQFQDVYFIYFCLHILLKTILFYSLPRAYKDNARSAELQILWMPALIT